MVKKLSKRQSAVLDELFNGEQTTEQILEKNGVNQQLYNQWHGEPAFTDEFERRIERLHRHSRLLIARYSSLAAARLVSLTESQSGETARKACLDIIDRIHNTLASRQETVNSRQNAEGLGQDSDPVSITPELAEKILAALAQ